MELSDAERTRLKEQRRGGKMGGWSLLHRLREEEQREIKRKEVKREEEGEGREGDFKAKPSGNSRLGCGGVSLK